MKAIKILYSKGKKKKINRHSLALKGAQHFHQSMSENPALFGISKTEANKGSRKLTSLW